MLLHAEGFSIVLLKESTRVQDLMRKKVTSLSLKDKDTLLRLHGFVNEKAYYSAVIRTLLREWMYLTLKNQRRSSGGVLLLD